MALRLWTSDDDSIDLGNTFEALKAFKGLAKAIGDRDSEFADLLGVTQTNDETLSVEYVSAVTEQAAKALKEFGGSLSDHCKWLLETIAGLKP